MKVYIVNRLPGVADSLLLQLLEGKEEYVGGLFQKIDSKPFRTMVSFVQTPQEADYLFLPHNYFSVSSENSYLKSVENFAAAHNKDVIVFAYGDSSEAVRIQHSIVLRTSQYRSQLAANEIIAPAFVEDLGTIHGVQVRVKTQIPIIGFAGWAGFASVKRYLVYVAKILITRGPYKQGVFFRRKALSILSRASNLKTLFVLRRTYSGHKNQIEGSPEMIRSEYIRVFQDSDLALIVKGDGNYSLRFFEALSLGKVPLFIDTDTPLPSEHVVPYDDFMIRIPWNQLGDMPSLINTFWLQTTPEQFALMQSQARKYFEQYLLPHVFYKQFFEKM